MWEVFDLTRSGFVVVRGEWDSLLQLLLMGDRLGTSGIYSPSLLRETHDLQFTLGHIPIADIQFDPNNRDDIPAVLMGHRRCGALLRSDEDDLYHAMDDLMKCKTEIECRLAKRHLKEGGLVLYDMTSSYFEGEKNKCAEYGCICLTTIKTTVGDNYN